MTDFEDVIRVFDEALNSDDPRVRQALNSLVMMVSLTRDTEGKLERGPFGDMYNELRNLRMDMNDLRRTVDRLTSSTADNHSWDSEMKRRMTKDLYDLKKNSFKQIWLDEHAQMNWPDLVKNTISSKKEPK